MKRARYGLLREKVLTSALVPRIKPVVMLCVVRVSLPYTRKSGNSWTEPMAMELQKLDDAVIGLLVTVPKDPLLYTERRTLSITIYYIPLEI